MNNIINFLLLSFLITGCASKISTKNIPDSNAYKLRYIIQYPSFKGMPKSQAKKSRRKYLNSAIEDILVSIYRIGDFGDNEFDSAKDISYGEIPFKVEKEAPLTLRYIRKPRISDFGSIMARVSRYGKSNSKKIEIIKPLAYFDGDIPLTPSKKQQDYIKNNFLLLEKSDLQKAESHFNKNYDIVEGNQRFINFLQKIQYWRIANKAPETNPSIYEILKSYKNISQGMGVASEEVDEKNTLSFVLNKYKHYPYNKSTGFSLDYDPSKFLWGLTYVLNSEIRINRLSKQLLEVIVTVPVNQINKMYTVKKVADFIE